MHSRGRSILGKGKNLTRLQQVVLATALAAPALAPAAVLYKTGFGAYDTQAAVGYNPNNASFTSSITTYTATGGSATSVAAGGLGEGRGDDYSTPFSTLTITSLRFVGNLQANADGFAVEFYNADGTRNATATIYPTEDRSTFTSSTAHTVTPNAPVTVSGSGYIVFAPYTYNYATGDAPQISLGYSDQYNAALYDVGTNNSATSVEANYGALYPATTDRTLSFVDLPFKKDVLSLELDGTGVPEPTSIALLAPAAWLLKRRRQD